MFKSNSPARKTIPAVLRICLFGIILLPCLAGIAAQGGFRHVSFAKSLADYIIKGTAFDDYNQNGTQDTREPGINGIIVHAYNSAGNSVESATTSTAGITPGQYTLTIPDGTGPVRPC